MPSQIESMPMEIDRDRSPSVNSDSSARSFRSDFETLPASGPINHAHVIDMAEYATTMKDQGTIKLQDAVVTTLFNVSVDTLRMFLSPTVNSFKAVFGKKDNQLVIWRKGIEVFIGTFEHHTSLKVYGFEHLAGFLIGYDGSWHVKLTAGHAYSNPKWPEVWSGKFESYGGVAKMTVEVEEQDMAKRASELADSMLKNRFWELKADVKTT